MRKIAEGEEGVVQPKNYPNKINLLKKRKVNTI